MSPGFSLSAMTIAIVGCGALGSYYGACLARAGHAVHFLLRSDFDAVRANGVRILSSAGDFVARPCVARDPAEIGIVELVVIGLKTTANAEFARLLPPLVGPGTAVLTLQNGLGNEDALARLFDPRQILGGLCFVCINRIAPGVIRHLAHGRILLGEFSGPVRTRTAAIAATFRDAGVPCDATDDLDLAHWNKLIWNIPFNGLGVAGSLGIDAVRTGRVAPGTHAGPCVPSDVLIGSPDWLVEVLGLMHEVIATARALGHPIAPDEADAHIGRTREMGSYLASTLVDHSAGRPLELESLFLEPLRRARMAGVATPRLENLCAILESIDSERLVERDADGGRTVR